MESEKIYSNLEIKNLILKQVDSDNLSGVEKQLRERLENTEDVSIEREEILSLYLMCLLKTHYIETGQIKKIFKQYLETINKIHAQLLVKNRLKKTKTTTLALEIFYSTIIHRLYYIENLYKNIFNPFQAEKAHILRKDFRKNLHLLKREYKKYIYFQLNKITSNYGTSFWYMFLTTLITTLGFGIFYYIYDLLSGMKFSGAALMLPIDYYIYISIATISNLGLESDFASSLLLRLVMWVEQILGVLLFGLVIVILGKKI